MWNATKSLHLSIWLVRTLFVLIIMLAVCVPIMVHWYDVVYGGGVGLVSGSVFWPLSICLYLAAVLGDVCLFFLGRLLTNIRRELVFVEENCRCLRVISWCCLLAVIPFFAFGFWRFLSFLVAFAAAFFGIILRVVKNVFEQAVALQDETNYTI